MLNAKKAESAGREKKSGEDEKLRMCLREQDRWLRKGKIQLE